MVTLLTISASAQTMKELFLAMPDSVAPLLTEVNRADCVDFLDSNMKAVVKNRFDQPSELKVLTEDYLQLQMTATSMLEMKLLPLNDSVKVVCMVRTVSPTAEDSEVLFYDAEWNRLPAERFLQLPIEDDFYLSSVTQDDEYVMLRKKADIYAVKMSLSSDAAIISFVYTTPKYLNEEDKEKLSAYLNKEPIVREWRDGAFR